MRMRVSTEVMLALMQAHYNSNHKKFDELARLIAEMCISDCNYTAANKIKNAIKSNAILVNQKKQKGKSRKSKGNKQNCKNT